MRLTSLLLLICLCGCHAAQVQETACENEAPQCAGNVADCPYGECESCTTAPGHCHYLMHPANRCSKYCRFIDNIETKKTALKLARADIRDLDDECDINSDFRYGFEQAYIDMARGASGEVPALPPKPYWKVWARTPEGHYRAQEWFRGYWVGAAQAQRHFGHFNNVASSGVPGYPPQPNSGHPVTYMPMGPVTVPGQ